VGEVEEAEPARAVSAGRPLGRPGNSRCDDGISEAIRDEVDGDRFLRDGRRTLGVSGWALT